MNDFTKRVQFKVGDRVTIDGNCDGRVYTIAAVNPEDYYCYDFTGVDGCWEDSGLTLYKGLNETVVPVKSNGGVTDYYDLRNGGTLNDELEYKGDTQWLGDSFHLGNTVKLAWRWGIKDGTTKQYDARKLIYSGARLLLKYSNVLTVRESLQELLDDPQFQEDKTLDK